jgi:hypothetical protein
MAGIDALSGKLPRRKVVSLCGQELPALSLRTGPIFHRCLTVLMTSTNWMMRLAVWNTRIHEQEASGTESKLFGNGSSNLHPSGFTPGAGGGREKGAACDSGLHVGRIGALCG